MTDPESTVDPTHDRDRSPVTAGRGDRTEPPTETGQTDGGRSSGTILIPVAILEGETVPEALVRLVAPLSVIVLGYHALPEQTAPGQARMQFEDEADAALTELAAAFADAGADVETRLVFTNDVEQTVNRVAEELDCDAVLVPGTLRGTDIESILLPKRGPIEVERIVSMLSRLVRGTRMTVTLFHAADDQGAAEDGRLMLRGAADLMEGAGVDPDRIATRVVVTDAPIAAVAEAAAEHDLVVVGESEPTLASIVFGDVHDRVAAAAERPVIVVRRAHHDADARSAPADLDPGEWVDADGGSRDGTDATDGD